MKPYIIITHLGGSHIGQIDGFLTSKFSELIIGRDPKANIKFDIIRDGIVGNQQAKISLDKVSQQYYLQDLGSRNGTFINKRRSLGAVKLKPGDIIQVGLDGPAVEFDISEELVNKTVAQAKPRIVLEHHNGSKAGQIDYISLNDFRELTIGRDANSMILYDANRDTAVSRNHAKITLDAKDKTVFLITDLQSRNGTFLNDKKVLGSTPLQPKDKVKFGFEGPSFLFLVT